MDSCTGHLNTCTSETTLKTAIKHLTINESLLQRDNWYENKEVYFIKYFDCLEAGIAFATFLLMYTISLFLAHLSTKCSDWTIPIVLCAMSIVGRQFFGLCTLLEATFSFQLSWNLIRMFVLINSRTSSKMGHVGSITRSLGKIL